MCGRLVAKTLKRIVREEGKGRTVRDLVIDYTDRYNIKPTQNIVVVMNDGKDWVADVRRWGFIDSHGLRINSMAETAKKYPGYFNKFERVLIPVSGWYEWPTFGGRKRPHFIGPAEPDTHWWFPGLMTEFELKKTTKKGKAGPASDADEVVDADSPESASETKAASGPTSPPDEIQLVEGVSLMTVAPTLTMLELHHRWPAMLQSYAEQEEWLDPKSKHKDLMNLLRPCPDVWIDAYEVGVVEGDGPHLIEPIPVKPRHVAPPMKGLFD